MKFLSALAFLAVVAAPAFAQQPEWAQCGGIGWSGGTTCASGLVCTVINPYHSQCLKGTVTTTPTTTPTDPTSTSTSTGSTPTGSLPPRGSLVQITNFGSNPTNVGIYAYVPQNLAASNRALIVAIHYCTGTAQAYYSGTPYKSLADQKGFIVIYPSSPHSGTCWDVSSKATLTHNGGGDSNAIANAAKYAIANWGVDPNKVFVTGSSSGAMMTNVLAATYPDIFKAGIVYSGVAAGCFVSSSGSVDAWNSTCANGQSIATAQAWANVVRNMYPGYTGSYPRMQEYHGTADTTLYPQNLQEEVKQWSGVNGYGSPTQVLQNTPLSGYTKSIYGPNLEGISGAGVGHSVPIQGAEDMKWFGL